MYKQTDHPTEKEETIQMRSESLISTLKNSKSLIPLYALPTHHKGMQKVRLRRKIRDEFHDKMRKSMLDWKEKGLGE